MPTNDQPESWRDRLNRRAAHAIATNTLEWEMACAALDLRFTLVEANLRGVPVSPVRLAMLIGRLGTLQQLTFTLATSFGRRQDGTCVETLSPSTTTARALHVNHLVHSIQSAGRGMVILEESP